ncbi:MAG: hypothetical protein WB770_10905 [Acidimicrobiales bacterium]
MTVARELTWAEIGWKNAGMRTTERAFKFAVRWGSLSAELGRAPSSIEEYAALVGESRASAFRDQQSFREAFPSEENPTRMNERSGAQARLNELWTMHRDRARIALAAQPLAFVVGGASAIE